jgi:hypothetical protein
LEPVTRVVISCSGSSSSERPSSWSLCVALVSADLFDEARPNNDVAVASGVTLLTEEEEQDARA